MRILEQLLAGRDFARANPAAGRMANFVYLIGDERSRECVLVDPAWDVRGLLGLVDARGLRLRGLVATHAHADHVGGRLGGMGIEGMAQICEQVESQVWVHDLDADRLSELTGLGAERVRRVAHGQKLTLGETEIEFLHTPGHTPGALCLLVGDALVTGDTLFVDECGRVDLPGSDPLAMWSSLNRTLAALPDQTVVYPGHDYGPTPTSTLREQKRTNPNLRVSLEEWRRELGI